MKKMISILIIAIVLLSGCISSTNDKSADNNTGNNGDEYADDGAAEETNLDNIQANYGDFDLNKKDSKVPVDNVRNADNKEYR